MSTTLNEIKAVTRTEKQKSGLQELADDFYDRIETRLSELYEKRDAKIDEVDNPFQCTEIQQTVQRIESIENEVESLHRLRSAKILDKAGFVAAGMGEKPTGATPAEEEMFEELVTDLTRGRQNVINAIDPENSASGLAAQQSDTNPSESLSESSQGGSDSGGVSASEPAINIDDSEFAERNSDDANSGVTASSADASTDDTEPVQGDREPEQTRVSDVDNRVKRDDVAVIEEESGEKGNPSRENDVERVTVKMKKSVGEILGVDDREYQLEENDVVTLPEQNASPLIDKEVAEQIEEAPSQ